jgi:hypothetical protein
VEPPPSKTRAVEIVQAVAEGVAGNIPFIGSPLAVALDRGIGRAHDKRMRAWFELVADAVSDLEDRVGEISIEDLVENDVFFER